MEKRVLCTRVGGVKTRCYCNGRVHSKIPVCVWTPFFCHPPTLRVWGWEGEVATERCRRHKKYDPSNTCASTCFSTFVRLSNIRHSCHHCVGHYTHLFWHFSTRLRLVEKISKRVRIARNYRTRVEITRCTTLLYILRTSYLLSRFAHSRTIII